MRILVEPFAAAPAARGGAGAARPHHVLEVAAGREPGSWPAIDDFDAIVSLGSEQSAMQSDVPWVAREVELLARAHERRIPVLGIWRAGAGEGTWRTRVARPEP